MNKEIKDNLQVAKNLLSEVGCAFVLLKDDMEPVYSSEIGLKPIMVILRQDKLGLENGVIADKVIGKAAALMLVLSKAQAVHGVVMSQAAVKVLDENGINYSYDTLVPFIENRTKTGMCPLEKCVTEISDPVAAFDEIESTIAELMKL